MPDQPSTNHFQTPVSEPRRMTRREVLSKAGMGVLGGVLAACGLTQPEPSPIVASATLRVTQVVQTPQGEPTVEINQVATATAEPTNLTYEFKSTMTTLEGVQLVTDSSALIAKIPHLLESMNRALATFPRYINRLVTGGTQDIPLWGIPVQFSGKDSQGRSVSDTYFLVGPLESETVWQVVLGVNKDNNFVPLESPDAMRYQVVHVDKNQFGQLVVQKGAIGTLSLLRIDDKDGVVMGDPFTEKELPLKFNQTSLLKQEAATLAQLPEIPKDVAGVGYNLIKANSGWQIVNGDFMPYYEWKTGTEQWQKMEINTASIPEGTLPKEIKIAKIIGLPNGMFEGKDGDGNVMAIRESVDSPWLAAPYGMSLKEGMWLYLDETSLTFIPDYKIPDFDTKLNQIYTIVEKTLDWNAVKPGTMGFIPGMNYGLEFKPGMDQKMYHDLVQSFLQTQYPQLRKFLAETGFTSESFLLRSKGPDGQPGWVPAVSPQGTHFVDIQGIIPTNLNMPQMRENIAIQNDGGFYFDKIGSVIFNPTKNQGDPFFRGWYQALTKMNTSNVDSLIHLGGPVGSSTFSFGLDYDPASKRLLFIVGSDHVYTYMPEYTDIFTVGGAEQKVRLEDGRMATTLFRLYLWALENVINNKFKYPQLCPSLGPNACQDVPGFSDYSQNYFKPVGQ